MQHEWLQETDGNRGVQLARLTALAAGYGRREMREVRSRGLGEPFPFLIMFLSYTKYISGTFKCYPRDFHRTVRTRKQKQHITWCLCWLVPVSAWTREHETMSVSGISLWIHFRAQRDPQSLRLKPKQRKEKKTSGRALRCLCASCVSSGCGSDSR